jgi:uncharacterized protein YfaS (alpha-2-macroglobulin family)
MKQLWSTITLVMILFSSTMAQQQVKPFNYAEKWKLVDKQRDNGLPKEALKIVDQIYKQAKTEQQHGHFLRSVFYKMGLMASFEEEPIEKALVLIDQEIKTASDPQKQILYSTKAEILWGYYQANRWVFLERTSTTNYKKEDIGTWDLRAIVDEVFKAYQASLTNDKLLKKTPLTPFDQIIDKKNGRIYRPTLYDLLAHRAIDFFMGEEPAIVKPAATFYLNDPKYMTKAQTFVAIPLSTPDSMSMKYYALDLLQKVIQFHLNDADATALIDANLKRLEFVKSNGVFENIDSLYLASLLNMHAVHATNPMYSTICYKLAVYYNNEASKYDSITNPSVQFNYVEALKYCNQGIEKYPNTIGENNCQHLKRQIVRRDLEADIEKNVIPNTNSRMLVEYRNVKTICTRIIPITKEEFQNLTQKYWGDELMKRLTALAYKAQFKESLPSTDDYQKRTVEVKVQPLPVGEYILLTCDNESFNYSKDPMSYVQFRVTNLSYIERSLYDGSTELAVFNRNNGKPVENAKVNVRCNVYNYTSRKYEDRPYTSGVTDKDGHFMIRTAKKEDNGQNLYFTISTKEDKTESENNLYQYYRDTTERTQTHTYFFTDRSIYRPGQTVYFKGITVETKGKNAKLITGKKSKILLYDVNWQEKSSMELVTNDFGSFNGSFIAPTGGLTGQMQIRNEFGAIYINVEEYKRPKFEATFNPIKGSYRLNDKVSVTGVAKAYAGNAIDGATVKYRVTRQASYPWWRWWWGYQPASTTMEIMNGETVTNEKGEYTITFEAIPDFNTKKRFLPLYNYTITADISDINGETHTTNTTVPVGYVSMYASVSLPSVIDQAIAPAKYDIRTTNLNHQLEPANIKVKVTQMVQPETYYNQRLWQKPSTFIYSKEEFSKLFPYDEYNNELDKNGWNKGTVIYERTHNTVSDTILQFENLSTWKSGVYIIEIEGVDKYGVAYGKSQYFSVTNSTKNENTEYTALAIRTNEYVTEPGKVSKITLESSQANAMVFLEFFKEGTVISKQWVELNKNAKTIDFPITEAHYGNISINAVMVINNRSYIANASLHIPKKNERLEVKFATFRDKLQPGQNEEWQLTIKGSDGEKVASELLATMYDASLDAFTPHYWSWYLSLTEKYAPYWNTSPFNQKAYANKYFNYPNTLYLKHIEYEDLNMYGFYFTGGYGYGRGGGKGYYKSYKKSVTVSDELVLEEEAEAPAMAAGEATKEDSSGENDKTVSRTTATGKKSKDGKNEDGLAQLEEKNAEDGRDAGKPIQIRSNFNETAFFMPQLATDAEGNVVIKFKAPESLTRWKIMGLAHTKDLRIGQFTKELVTQKELMVVPNQPRFFRESDQMEFNAKISNISDKDLIGIAKIEFFDGLTMKPINSELGLTTLEIPFSALKGQSTSVAWKIAIPQGLMAITYRVTAQAGNFSDGEEMTLPVLTNRMLVTESLPLPINGNQTKTFSFDKLKNNTSTTLKNFKYTLEFTSNPAWYAIQALPYLMEYPYECSEQTFNRFYANSIATHIANSSPKIKAVFESWKINSPEALMSNLEKNQELKSLMLEETPWVLDAKSETEQKKRIGLLFDIINMSSQLDAALNKLIKMQTSNGGWSWFPGMLDNEYITQYIVTGFGHLKNLGITNLTSDTKTWAMITRAVRYTDDRIRENYEDLKKWKVDMTKDHLGWSEIQYLYARSFFWKDVEIASKNKEAVNYYLNQSKKYWLTKGVYMQGMIAIANMKTGDPVTAKKVIASVKDNALYSEEMGMYWRNEGGGYYWYEAPIERQALLIEAFDVVNSDLESVEKMKIWLLKQKQTQNWGTTKSTAEACYALLLKGTSQLVDDQLVEIKIGDKVIDPKKMDNVKVEAGTGYFKTAWNGTEITPNMGNITVTKSTAGVAWGSVYWQYFENLDKITPAATPLSMKKELFIVRATPTGEVLEPVKAGDKIKVGDKIRVRIVLRSDRDMEYVHMKDMRAAAFEPISVLSEYKYQDGLGYYESTRDAATNFFFDYLRKGTYVFEYSLFATQKGDFSNGITTIQCMYAPEFTSHSEGVRVVVE